MKKGGPSRPRYRGCFGPASRGFVTLASPDHVSNPLTEAGAGPKAVLEHVDVGRHASAVASRARSTAASLEADASGHDRGSADGNGPREGAHDEGDREEGYHVRDRPDRKSTRLNSSHGYISYAVFCLKKKTQGSRGGGDAARARRRQRQPRDDGAPAHRNHAAPAGWPARHGRRARPPLSPNAVPRDQH